MPLYKKKESLTSKYSKIPNVIYCEELFFPISLMKMSLNFKCLYNYFTPLFFESSGSGVSINANNSVLNFYINK
jgi:hypothetical protein